MADDSQRLVIVSNRGPAQFERDAEGNRVVSRGGGGLVSALTDLVSHRPALWIASALSDEDIAVSAEAGGPVEPCPVEQLLLLRGGAGMPAEAFTLAGQAAASRDQAGTAAPTARRPGSSRSRRRSPSPRPTDGGSSAVSASV